VSAFELEIDVRSTRGDFRLEADLLLSERHAALFGPSGCGKTTLLHMLAGITRPDAGRVRLNGRVLFDDRAGIMVPAEERGIGYVFQENRLFPHKDVRANLLFSPRAGSAGVSPDFEGVVEMLELGPLLKRRTDGLSGGEARRVALGRALLSAPRMLILDEPFTGLDQGLKSRLLPYLRRIREEAGVPMLIVSHAPAEILSLTEHVVMMAEGCVLGQGNFHDLLGDPRVFPVASALGLENLLKVRVASHDPERGVTRADLSGRELVLPQTDLEVGVDALVGIRPDEIILAREEVRGLSAQNVLEGRVEDLTAIRGGFMVRIDIGQPLRVEVTEMARRGLGLAPGAFVWVLAKTFSFRWQGALRR